ncbi:MAG: M1 family peptidase, partial [Flavobacteriales bacterium]
ELNADKFYYEVTVDNVGGLIMPVIIEFEFIDGTKRQIHIPAEIWKRSEPSITKVFSLEKEAKSITLDPLLETADVELNNNFWPARIVPSKFELFKQGQPRSEENPMQRAKRE